MHIVVVVVSKAIWINVKIPLKCHVDLCVFIFFLFYRLLSQIAHRTAGEWNDKRKSTYIYVLSNNNLLVYSNPHIVSSVAKSKLRNLLNYISVEFRLECCFFFPILPSVQCSFDAFIQNTQIHTTIETQTNKTIPNKYIKLIKCNTMRSN